VGKRRKEGMGFARQGGVQTMVPKRRKGRGVRYGDKGENREPTRVLGKEGRIVQENEASAAPCHGHASAAHVGPRHRRRPLDMQ
jgi:hypothetical protein